MLRENVTHSHCKPNNGTTHKNEHCFRPRTQHIRIYHEVKTRNNCSKKPDDRPNSKDDKNCHILLYFINLVRQDVLSWHPDFHDALFVD